MTVLGQTRSSAEVRFMSGFRPDCDHIADFARCREGPISDIAPYLRMQSHDNLMRIDAPGRGIHLLSTPLAEVRT